MSRRNVDKRILLLIKKSVQARHRSMFFIFGESFPEQVVILHHLLLKFRERENIGKPIPLWCFKKDLGFNLFHSKKLKKLRKAYSGNYSLCQEDMFEHFLLSSNMQVCHYSETDKILGQTYGMLIIQDFNALTPNILARIIECVEGGGIIVFLLSKYKSLEQISAMHMDAHSKYVTEAVSNLSPLFNNRFVLSLFSCKNCLVVDESLAIKMLPKEFEVSEALQNEHRIDAKVVTKNDHDTGNYFSKILSLCLTTDQANSLEKLNEVLHNKNHLSVIALTSGRGRGKSAVLGLAVCLAINMDLSNIYVTSPHLENVQTLFTFLKKGLQALAFEDGKDFKVLLSISNSITYTTGIQILRQHKQSVIYLPPLEFSKLGNADLVVIDEAAAIPLTVVKKWIGPYNVCMASTINGYEGTGRSLSLKLITQLRNQSFDKKKVGHIAHTLHEITLNEPIRYSNGDYIETWINNLLCLDATIDSLIGATLPSSETCHLYQVNKEALFSYNKYAEKFLQQIMSLFVTSHYKNTPNDLLMMADAPAHHIFCLLPPIEKEAKELPNVLCVVQVALEGKISVENYNYEQSHGRRSSGDLIPWIISQQFQEESFMSLSGARVVRIATHPDCQSMGYGRHALELLCQFYSKSRRKNLPVDKKSYEDNVEKKPSLPLLMNLDETPLETLDYIGVSYGLTAELLKFWKRSSFIPLYIRQTTSDVTGEHSCIMVKALNEDVTNRWLSNFYADFTSRFVSLLPSAFNSFNGTLALSILHVKKLRLVKSLSFCEIQWLVGGQQLRRLGAYCNHMVDHHLVLDLLPAVSKLYFCGHLNGYFLSSVQEVILLSMGLQNKSVEVTSSELNMEVQQVMGCFRKALKKILSYLHSISLNANSKNLSSEKEHTEKLQMPQKNKLSMEEHNQSSENNNEAEYKSKKKK